MEKGKKTPATGYKAERERLKTRDKERDSEQKNSDRAEREELQNQDRELDKREMKTDK